MGDQAQPATRFAERVVRTRSDEGVREKVTIWIDHVDVDGGAWSVGRAVDLEVRTEKAPRPEEVFRGFELGDALEAANGALEDEIAAAEREEGDGNDQIRPFTEQELQRRLERWFFERANARR